ncbi:Mut7-C RNAse domain-containing protein [Pontibacter locisalis]|uniref:Mut7-C RNAse domain-containing protein n=1 Tax=Pontibacter locisalis TaxID=1719035 RepID=A0ABW5IH46_9BACT
MQNTASFRFYGALNDFLRSRERGKELEYTFNSAPAVKDAIEAIGIPHPEVQAILVNEKPVGFSQPLLAGDRVEVYPYSSTMNWPADYALVTTCRKSNRFVLDVHLGTLAKSLRMLGFDCYYRRDLSDKRIAEIAQEEQRIVLTRDVGLLKQKTIERGYWLRSQQTEEQLNEVMQRYNLLDELDPLTRCLVCNTFIKQVEKQEILNKVPPKTRLYFEEFYQCPSCEKVYWKGSHYERMLQYIAHVKQNFTS